jgi:hypothetical protein
MKSIIKKASDDYLSKPLKAEELYATFDLLLTALVPSGNTSQQ